MYTHVHVHSTCLFEQQYAAGLELCVAAPEGIVMHDQLVLRLRLRTPIKPGQAIAVRPRLSGPRAVRVQVHQ
jgi:hypothetical protein